VRGLRGLRSGGIPPGGLGYEWHHAGEKFKNIYTVVQKLGWGHFSTVWLVQKDTSREFMALKIQRSKDTHTESAVDELEILTEIRKHEEDPEWV
jgi:serine/threonine protein kinase